MIAPPQTPIGQFSVRGQAGKARAGLLSTSHGLIQTPAFMAVGTRATVRTMTTHELAAMGCPVILGNTYHLHIRPGEALIKEMGGLHKFMNWHGPMLTDSGGFQVFSLAKNRKIPEEGVTFKSHVDGSTHFISPEVSMQIQMDLGADIVMAFDECLEHPASRERIEQSMHMTHRWLIRSKEAMTRKESLLFGTVQGGLDIELRKKSLELTCSVDLPGYALGGLSVGEPPPLMHAMLKEVAHLMPADKPRYLMGVGTPLDLIHAADSGIDMFDCVMPARVGRNGTLFTSQRRVSIKRVEYRNNESPLDPFCDCYTCTHYSKGYLRHLLMLDEALSARLNTIHNLHFYFSLMRKSRAAILAGTWDSFRDDMLTRFVKSTIETSASADLLMA